MSSPHAEFDSFIVFADDWGAHPSSCQHLFRRIADRYPTLWVNTVGLRPPRIARGELARVVRKVRTWVAPARRDEHAGQRAPERPARLSVLAPPMVPWMRPAPARALNRLSVQRAVRAAARSLGLARPVLVTTVPNGVDAAGACDERALVYYCVDDFTRWPGVDGVAAAALEAELLARADGVLATSDELLRTRRPRDGAPAELLPHGVDLAHFGRAADPATAPHPGVARDGRPVLGYLGLIDARTDVDLVRQVARARRDWDLVLVGPTDGDGVAGALAAEPNVRLLPAVPYARVPEVLAAFDVAVLPYARNALTAAINPLKLREYLASGRPVVATALPEVARFAPHVRLADDAAGFVREADAALAGPRDLRAARAALLRGEGWDDRAERFLALCDDAVRARVRRGDPTGAAHHSPRGRTSTETQGSSSEVSQ